MDLGVKILVVDDFASMRSIVISSLGQLGFNHIFEAKDGVTAFDAAKKEHVGLILCDWNMPNMNGLELLKKVRSDADLKDTPFIMITAEGKKENVMEAVKAGVNNYVTKPFDTETLRKKIEKAVAS